MKSELYDKDTTIDKLKKDIKLTKGSEIETELQVYIEECNRLRTMLEGCMMNMN